MNYKIINVKKNNLASQKNGKKIKSLKKIKKILKHLINVKKLFKQILKNI